MNYFTEISDISDATGAALLAGAQGCSAMGRFSGSFFMRFVRSRYIFLFYLISVIAFCSAAIMQRRKTGIAMFMLTLFFDSVCFFQRLWRWRFVGRDCVPSGRRSGLVVRLVLISPRFPHSFELLVLTYAPGGGSGGAAVPPRLGVTSDLHNSTSFASVVPVCFFIAAWSYALCVNFVPPYENVADPIGNSQVGLQPNEDEDGRGKGDGG